MKRTTTSRATPRGRLWPSGLVRTVRYLRRRCSRSAPWAPCPRTRRGRGGTDSVSAGSVEEKQENQEQWLERDPEIKCYLPGVPRATYMAQPFQILQNSSAIFIAYQYAGATRNIYMKDPGPPPVDSWMGQSVGRWDGDTLVVDVKGFNDQTWFDRSGNFHSDKLHVVERYTRTAPDVISYEATIEDPRCSRSWKIAMPLYRRLEKNAQLMDFKCVEFVEELLYGQWRKKPCLGRACRERLRLC